MKGEALWRWLLVLGIVLAVLAVVADPLGLGGYPGFGWRQTTMLVVGVVVATVAAVRLRRR
ncbi:MAG: hypothetical protein ACUVRY_09810 [Thermoanaerobaculaceae bacterium]